MKAMSIHQSEAEQGGSSLHHSIQVQIQVELDEVELHSFGSAVSTTWTITCMAVIAGSEMLWLQVLPTEDISRVTSLRANTLKTYFEDALIIVFT